MKRFILLSLISLSAQAACDYEIRDRMFRTEEQKREFRCELNFKCAEKAIRDENSDPAELEILGDYSRKNNCNDELKLADLFASLMEDEREFEDPAINNSERGNSKADLPVIPDAPVNSGSRTQRQ